MAAIMQSDKIKKIDEAKRGSIVPERIRMRTFNNGDNERFSGDLQVRLGNLVPR